jgi:hypothetical protein
MYSLTAYIICGKDPLNPKSWEREVGDKDDVNHEVGLKGGCDSVESATLRNGSDGEDFDRKRDVQARAMACRALANPALSNSGTSGWKLQPIRCADYVVKKALSGDMSWRRE